MHMTINLQPQDLVRERRNQLGYLDTEVAAKMGVSISQYCELEEERDEFYMVVPLAKIAVLCHLLKIDINEIYGFKPCQFEFLTDSFIQHKRLTKGLTAEELSERVGIAEESIHELEKNPHSIGNWVMDPLLQLSIELNTQPACLLKFLQ